MNDSQTRNLFDALASFYEWHWGRAFLEDSVSFRYGPCLKALR